MSMQEQRDIPEWSFADRLRKARRHAHLTQPELARKLQVPVSRLSNWEADANKPDDIVTIAKRVQAATRVPAMWLLTGDGPSPRPGPDDDPTEADTTSEVPNIGSGWTARVTPLRAYARAS